jgi:hypothetical protein
MNSKRRFGGFRRNGDNRNFERRRNLVAIDWDDEFEGFCEQATDAQLAAIYRKETDNERPAYAAIAKAVAKGRGLPDPSLERVQWREDNERR